MNLLNKVVKQIAFILVLIFSISTTYGQVNKTVGTRITDTTTDKELKENAILDLESTSKGFFLPRMTTLQRDAIKKNMGKDNGLAVYNIDNDCVEYWSERADKWMSLCGSLPPAKLDLDENSCEGIQFVGIAMVDGKPQFQQGKALDPDTQWMTVRLKVNQIGTYTISANSNNGYFFSGEGQFQSTGTYQIVMKGMGTPIKGYNADASIKGDKLQFSLNGIESKVCTNVEVLVQPAELDFEITSKQNIAKGKYHIADAASLKKGNSIEIGIKVLSDGLATVTAVNKTLGMKFVGSKNVGINDKILILEPLLGSDVPSDNDLANYEFTFEVNTKDPKKTINDSSAILTVEQTELQGIFKDVDFGKEPYYQTDVLNENHTLTLPVKVISSGRTNLYLKGEGNLEFIAENVMLTMPQNAESVQKIVFKAVKGGVLPNTSTTELTLSGNGKRLAISGNTTLTLPLQKKLLSYTIDCSSVIGNRGAIPNNKPIGEVYYIKAKVNVNSPGEYEINTSSSVDGILFSTTRNGKKQTFSTSGVHDVELYAVDGTVVPTKKGDYTVSLVANDVSNATCANVKIKIGFNDLNILIIKGESQYWNSITNESLFFSGKNSNGKLRFGPTGEYVVTGTVKVNTYEISEKNNEARINLIKEINEGKYNFVLLSGQKAVYYINKELADALYNLVINNKGALWLMTPFYHANVATQSTYIKEFSGRGTNPDGLDLISRFNNGNDMNIANYPNDSGYNMIVVNANDPLVKPRHGFNYISRSNGSFYDISWYRAPQLNNFTSIDASGTNFRPLVADRGTKFGEERGLVFVHRTYENLFWAPIGSSWYEGTMRSDTQNDAKSGEAFKSDKNTIISTNTGAFASNIFTAIIERLANQ